MANEMIVLYFLLAAIAGMIYSLRRIFLLEEKIEKMEERILKAVKGKRKR